MSIKTSKYLWFFSGFWVLLGGIVSAAALLGGTVGDFLGLKDLLINLPLYDLAVIYRSNSSLVHILSLLFLVSWSLQGYFTFLMQSKNISVLFVGVNIIQLPVWLYSFWDLINPVLATVQILIVLSLFLSWALYPWHDLLRKKILLNINEATDIVEKSNSTVQKKSNQIIKALMENGNNTVSNEFTAKCKMYDKTCQVVLSEMENIKERTKKTIKASKLEGYHVDSTLCLNKARVIQKDDLLIKGDDEIQKLIKDSMGEQIDEIVNMVKTLNNKYTLSNLPDNLSELHYRDSFYHIMDFSNKKFMKDINDPSTDFSKLFSLILKRISKIDEFIENHTTMLTDSFNHLIEETEKLNTVAEVIENENLRQKVDEICISPINNKLNPSKLAEYNKDLLFDEAEDYFEKIADEIEEANDNIDFIYTLVLMIKSKKSKSSIFTDIEKRQIESNKALVTELKFVLGDEFGIDMSNLLIIDSIKNPLNTEESTKNIDYTKYLDDIQSILFLIEEKMKTQKDRKHIEFEYFSEKSAEAFRIFVSKNYDSDLVCHIKDKLIVVDFLNDYSTETITKMIEKVEMM